ncbi:MAG TPA: GGDEF domain-containing protein [Negativicutes bacterium]|nr:GGDEF domain-containing protein [Negativicutes bacterium]
MAILQFFNKSLENLETSEMTALMTLKSILKYNDLRIVFQPIVSLSDAEIIGYEALSRGPQGSLLERPDALFATAAKFDLVWELEYLCRAGALEKAKDIIVDKMLFINVDPNIINDPRFQKGHTRELLQKFYANAGNVIFEITEKTAINDYKSFCRILDNYTSQGYKIAIDDTGSGYSGLRTLAETRPHFIKIDMELIRNVDKDSLKQAMLKALYDFSISTNSKIIAEGIETQGELSTLIKIGIPYGQGFFLQKPQPDFAELSPALKETIGEINRQKEREKYHTPITMPVGEIAQQDTALPSTTLGYTAIDFFNEHSNMQGLPIVDHDRPVGLLMKGKFFANLATRYGIAVYMNRPIATLMDHDPLIVDYHTPLELVSKSALSRKDDDIYDYILVTRDEKYFGTLTVKMLLEKTTQLELNRAKHANPLTGLPGNVLIEDALNNVIRENAPYAVLYFDLDNFKPYNDTYGFDNGDKVLCFTAELIKAQLNRLDYPDSFLGHIGGDDFIAIIRRGDVPQLCQQLIREFDHKIPRYYSQEDRHKGCITAKNRHGFEEEYPLLSLSIAVVTNRHRQFSTVCALSETASQLKRKCKLDWRSCYCIE